MGDVTESQPALDSCVSSAINLFLRMPAEPQVTIEASIPTSSPSTVADAAERTLASTTTDAKIAMLAELVVLSEQYDFYPDCVFSDENTYRDVLYTLLKDIIASRMIRSQIVVELQKDNLRRHDEWRQGGSVE